MLSEKQVLSECRRRQRRHWRPKERVKVVMEALWGAGRTAVLHMHIKEEWPERGKSNAEGGTR